VKGFSKLNYLNIANISDVADQNINELIPTLPSLKHFLLWNARITNDTAKTFTEYCPLIETLEIAGSNFSGDGIAALIATCRDLKRFRIPSTNANDAGLQNIDNLRVLQHLDMSFVREVTDVGLQYVAKCHWLRNLRMTSMERISMTGLRFIAEGCKALAVLELRGNKNLSGPPPKQQPGAFKPIILDQKIIQQQQQEYRQVMVVLRDMFPRSCSLDYTY